MRFLVARCSVTYAGRLGASLAPGVRLVLWKADGSIAVHSDAKAYKPLNWMSPPCTIVERDDTIVATNPKGEVLRIEIHETLHDTNVDLGDDPGLEKDGVEAELQQLIAARVARCATTSFSFDANTPPTSVPSTCCAATATGARSWWR